MARGQKSKEEVMNKILELFPNSFIYEKEIRIPYKEDDEDIQLKCVLTCAKVNVERDGDIAIPGNAKEEKEEKIETIVVPTQEEKDTVKNLLESFGL